MKTVQKGYCLKVRKISFGGKGYPFPPNEIHTE
jgi:hypothetical protein